MKTAIVYDRVNKWGGAERVLLTLHELFPRAPLYTSVYNKKGAAWAEVFPQIIPSFLQRIPLINSKHECLAPLMPLAFESLDLSGFDLVISVTSESAKGIITKPGTLHVCYCLTPTRYLWSHHEEYFKGNFFKFLSKPVVCYLRRWDKIISQRPDIYIAISTQVKKRIEKYYKKDSQIIFPPVDIQRFNITKKMSYSQSSRSSKKELCSNTSGYSFSEADTVPVSGYGKYYLIVSRLVPYKKIDLAVDVFNDLGLPLIVVGTGSEEVKLRKKARENIKFTGFVNDEELPAYYKDAKAFIYPQEEDFGITAVEAQAAGIPVIAYKAGGVLDTVIEGVTGYFFEKQNKKSLTQAVKKFDESVHPSVNKEGCIKNAHRFSKEIFKKNFLYLIEKQKIS